MDPYVLDSDWKPSSAQRVPARVNPVVRHPAESVLSLDGAWRFRLDPRDEGRRERWFSRPERLRETVQVPGCWQGQGFGHDGEDDIWDFRIRTRTFRATYCGTGWYGRTFRVPEGWEGRRLWLNFGGVHPSAEVWLNGERLGAHAGPFVPFGFEVSSVACRGRNNVLVVRVHEANRWLGLAYNWAGNWSGLFRGVELSATGVCWLDRFWVHPDVEGECLQVRAATGGTGREPLSVTVSAGPVNAAAVAETTRRLRPGRFHRFRLPLPSPRRWSPDEPNLYRVDAVLRRGQRVVDALSARVGFVALATEGKRLLINGEPYYMRGSGDFVANPETGSPDTSRERWRRKLRTLRDYGYNYVRCQSYVPAPEYYDAADDVGLLVQGEMGMLGGWGGSSPWHRYAWPAPTPAFREALRWQWTRTVMRDVNHPSASLYCLSNELGRETLFPRTAWRCFRETKAIKPSALVIWTDGGYNRNLPGDFVNDQASLDRQTELPVIQHEFRWWSAAPDVRIRRKYRGAVRPYAIAIAERAARTHGLTRLLPKMAEVSQRLQVVEARTHLEACRRDHPRLAGICHFNAMDIGLSPQGVLDEFYERKAVSARTWRQTNGDTVVMIDRDFDDRVLVGGEFFQCTFLISDFAHPPLERPVLEWRLVAGGKALGGGRLLHRHRPFRTCRIGMAQLDLPDVSRPLALRLEAVVRSGRREVGNQWDFWLLPAVTRLPRGVAVWGKPRHTWLRTVRGLPQWRGAGDRRRVPRVLLAETLDADLAEFMRGGGRVVLAAPEGIVRPFATKLGGGGYFFLPPANYPPLEDGHSGSMVSGHPMLGDLPHQGFADLQFYRLISRSPPVDLAPLGLGRVQPVIRAFSTYFVCAPLAYLADVRLGRGGLVLCALGLDQKLPEGRYLLSAILRYARGAGFRPRIRAGTSAVRRLLQTTLNG